MNDFQLRTHIPYQIWGNNPLPCDFLSSPDVFVRFNLLSDSNSIRTESVTLSEAIPKILQVLCKGFGWELGELWRVDPVLNRLRLEDIWYAPSFDASEFEKISRETTFSPGIGLPGRVWAGGEPAVWIADVLADGNFPRAPVAAKVGLHGAVAFPLTERSKVIGIIAFFSKKIRPLDKNTLRHFADIGVRIGSFINWKQAEELLRANKRKYRTLLENLPLKIFHKDKELLYVSCNENYARDLGIKASEIGGKTDYDFYQKELAEKYREDDKRILESGRVEELEEKYIKGGRELIVQTIRTPIKDNKGNITGEIGIFWDITY